MYISRNNEWSHILVATWTYENTSSHMSEKTVCWLIQAPSGSETVKVKTDASCWKHMLEIYDIPDYYPRKKLVLKGHGKQFWNKPRKNISLKNTIFQYIDCKTDTTFQLFSAKKIPATFPHNNSIRFFYPYSARHLDWYIDPNNLTKCQKFYMENTTSISHWNNNNWKGQYHGNKIPQL